MSGSYSYVPKILLIFTAFSACGPNIWNIGTLWLL